MRIIADQSRTAGNANTSELLKAAEEKIDSTISKKISALTNQVKKNNFKELLKTAVVVLVVLLLGSGATLFVLNYRSGTQIAEQKAIQALRDRESEIEKRAIADYKASDHFKEDACKVVAENIAYIDTEYFLHKYIRSEDIQKYRLTDFYKFIKAGAEQYKEKKNR